MSIPDLTPFHRLPYDLRLGSTTIRFPDRSCLAKPQRLSVFSRDRRRCQGKFLPRMTDPRPRAPVSITKGSGKPGGFTGLTPRQQQPRLYRGFMPCVSDSETPSSADYRQSKTAPKDRRPEQNQLRRALLLILPLCNFQLQGRLCTLTMSPDPLPQQGCHQKQQ